VDRRDLREAAEHEEITVNRTAATAWDRKEQSLYATPVLPVLSETVATVSLTTARTSREVSN